MSPLESNPLVSFLSKHATLDVSLMTLPKPSRKAITGLVFIYVAAFGWMAEFALPFTKLPHKPIIFTIVLIGAELSFVIGVALLGRSYYKQLKTWLLTNLRGKKAGQ